MFSNNLRHKQLYRWLCNKTTKPTQENSFDDQFPYVITSNGNSLTYDDNVEIINENDRNFVSFSCKRKNPRKNFNICTHKKLYASS